MKSWRWNLDWKNWKWNTWNRWSFDARLVLVTAETGARDLRHGHVGPEHILLAILAMRHSLVQLLMASLGVEPHVLRDAILERYPPADATPAERIPFDRRAKDALANGLREALVQGQRWVEPEHLFVGLLSVRDNEAVAVLTAMGITHRTTQDALRSLSGVSVPVNVLVATDDGVERLEIRADGTAVKAGKTLNGEAIGFILTNLTNPSVCFAGSRAGHGTFRSGDGARTWRAVGPSDRSVHAVTPIDGDDRVLLVGTDAGVFVTHDGGRNYARLLDDGPVLVIDHYDDRIVAALHDGVVVSSDSGATWRRSLAGRSIRTMGRDPTRPELFVVGSDAGALVSKDGAESWRPAGGLRGRVANVAFDRFLFGIVRVCTEEDGRTFVYVSDDGGRKWPRRPIGVVDLTSPRMLVQHPVQRRALLLAGNDSGRGRLLTSDDEGERWRDVQVPDLAGAWDIAPVPRPVGTASSTGSRAR